MIDRKDVILVSGENCQGTGFLVRVPDGAVLITALHVVVDIQPEPLTFPSRIICTYSRKDGTVWCNEIEWKPENRPNFFDDWVAIRVSDYGDTKRWDIAELVSSIDDPERQWFTYGFPYEGAGLAMTGTFITTGGMFGPYDGSSTSSDNDRQVPVLQLSSDALRGEDAHTPEGFSGGPIIVDGFVVGVFRSFYSRESNLAAGGSGFAIPIQRIAAELGLQCPRLWTAADRDACALLDLKKPPSLKFKHSRLDEAPSELLRADSQTVVFDASGRRNELGMLDAFIEGDEPYLIFAAKGGAGKTRLLIEYCHRLRDQGWMAGFVPTEILEDLAGFMRRLCAGQADRLLIFDYVETASYIAGKFIAQAARQRVPKIRVVLLSRDSSTPARPLWWERLLAVSGVPLFQSAWTELAPLYKDLRDRRRGFELALISFHGDVPPSFPDLSNPLLSRPLYLHAIALLSARGGAAHVSKLDDHGILAEILRHERTAWARWFEHDVGSSSKTVPTGFYRAMDALLMLATLVGPVPWEVARMLVERCVDELDCDELITAGKCLREVYGEGRIRPLEPDLLGEQLVYETLGRGRVDEWIDVVADSERSMAQLSRALVIFSRLAQARTDTKDWSSRLLSKHGESIVGRISTWHGAKHDGARAPWTAHVDSPGLALERTARNVVDSILAKQLLRSIPHKTVELLELAVLLGEVLIEEERRQGTFSKMLATHLTNLGARLIALGKRQEAVDASREAMRVLSELATEEAGLGYDLVAGLNNLGLALFDVGERVDAMKVTEECIRTCQELNEDGLDQEVLEKVTSTHACAMSNLAMILAKETKYESAREAARDSIKMLRHRRESNPTSFQADELARVLNIMAEIESQLGCHEEAFVAVKESVEIYRLLLSERPDLVQREFPNALITYGVLLSRGGRSGEAERVTEEAIELLRKLTKERPNTFNHVLAAALGNLSESYAKRGQMEEALRTVGESVAILRDLSQQEPRVFLLNLAVRLLHYGEWLYRTGATKSALEICQELVGVCRRLVGDGHALAALMLADALQRVHDFGHLAGSEPALSELREAVELYRVLAQTDPAVHLPRLASTLIRLSESLYQWRSRLIRVARSSETSDYRNSNLLAEAVLVGKDAVVAFRRLVDQQPERYSMAFAQALVALVPKLCGIGAPKEGVECAMEAVARLKRAGNDDIHRILLGRALRAMCFALETSGSPELALVYARESVDLLRQVAHSKASAPEIMLAYGNLGELLYRAGESTEALRMLRECVIGMRGLDRSSFEAVQVHYVHALRLLELVLRDVSEAHAELEQVSHELDQHVPHRIRSPEAFAAGLRQAARTTVLQGESEGSIEELMGTAVLARERAMRRTLTEKARDGATRRRRRRPR